MRTPRGLLRDWLSQDVARTNAAHAATRMQHRRRQRDEVTAYLETQAPPPAAPSRLHRPRRR
jgi:hypothetical protein